MAPRWLHTRSLSLSLFTDIAHKASSVVKRIFCRVVVALFAVSSAQSAMAGCGYCVTPSFCDTGPSRYNCSVIFNLGGEYCKLSYSVICSIINPLRMTDEKRVAEVEVSDSGLMQAVAIWQPTEHLPIQFQVEKSKSLFSVKLAPLYSVHPSRPIYKLTSWSAGLSRPLTAEQ